MSLHFCQLAKEQDLNSSTGSCICLLHNFMGFLISQVGHSLTWCCVSLKQAQQAALGILSRLAKFLPLVAVSSFMMLKVLGNCSL